MVSFGLLVSCVFRKLEITLTPIGRGVVSATIVQWPTQAANKGKEVRHYSLYNSQDVETTQVSMDEWIKEMWICMYTMEHYSVIKKNKEILPFDVSGPWGY